MRSRSSSSKSSHSDKTQTTSVPYYGEYTEHVISPLLFSSKSSGTNSRQSQSGQEPPPPLQVINPRGSYGIALPIFNKRTNHDEMDRFNINTVVVSGPEDSEIDKKKLKFTIISFILLGFVNIICTCLLYLYPNSMDISKVLPLAEDNINQLAFVEIPNERSNGEVVLFYATLVNICIGIVSAFYRQPTGIACYLLTAILIFFIGFPSIPYFFYVIRYCLDAFQAYVALVLKSQLTVNFLKIHG